MPKEVDTLQQLIMWRIAALTLATAGYHALGLARGFHTDGKAIRQGQLKCRLRHDLRICRRDSHDDHQEHT